MLRFTYRQTV